MKTLGMLVIVLAAFALGYSKRKAMLERETSLSALAALAAAVRANAQYERASALVCLERFSASERSSPLEFLPPALEAVEAGETLGGALKASFSQWRDSDAIDAALASEISEFLGGLASSSAEEEIRSCAYIESRIAERLTEIRSENAQRRGFYETVYTLAGAAAAIALI